MNRYTTYESPLGQILLASDGYSLTGAYFSGRKHEPVPAQDDDRQMDGNLPLFQEVSRQLREYFAARRMDFHVPLRFRGTPFQVDVWRALLEIPAGQTMSYGELADRLGRRNAVRAVGGAVGRNPISIVVPCHRVVGGDGSLTGYAGGLDRKRVLLDLERTGASAVTGPFCRGTQGPAVLSIEPG
jgi:methylated-DNA-[protein]-cysteine S-methyltransferase